MPSETTPREHWKVNTARLASQIQQAAQDARSEEDLKMRVEPLLQKAFSQIGVDVEAVEYEKRTALKAKMDAVYGYVIIEYKIPGSLGKVPSRRKAQRQVERYLQEESLRHKPHEEYFLEKAVGVVIDGQHILFVRYSRLPRMVTTPVPIEEKQPCLFPGKPVARGFHLLGPFPIARDSLSNLLIFMRATARKPLTAENLAKVFGPENVVARQAVVELYSAAMRAHRLGAPSRIKTFFTEWDRIFGMVYGEELEKAQKAAEETSELYQLPGGIRLKQLLFAIHTYYAFLMKLIAVELLAMQSESMVESFARDLTALDDSTLKERLVHLESGADFNRQGIVNFLEADFFSWYLDGWEPRLATVFRNIVRAIADFEPATPVLEPGWTRDLLKKLYEMIVPRRLRHGLGEYYTPDWLAEYLIEKSGYAGEPKSRFLDPACGSGTFLVQAIQKVLERIQTKKHVQLREVAQLILNNVIGFDLNPLAVLAARTNYLIAFAPFIPHIRPISIPVYLCDSVLAPTRTAKEGELFQGDVVYTTTKGNYTFPLVMQDKENIDLFTGLVEIGIRGKYDKESFGKLLAKELPLSTRDQRLLVKVYGQIKELEDRGENGIWARYLKNAFAPVYVGKFDFVVGNPPWIRWGYLSTDYRKRTLKLWHDYGLFSLKGHEARLGAGEKDFSMLFTYACSDYYLNDGGHLGFVITLEVFKSKGAGEGFRGFELKQTETPLRVLLMEDMVNLKPFQAANKTSIFVIKRGEPTSYPVPSKIWKRKPGVGSIPANWILNEVMEHTERTDVLAIPVDPQKDASSWQIADRATIRACKKMKGQNPYKAHLGARVEPYGIFWLEIKNVRSDGKLVVSNMHDRGKREIPSVTVSIEKDLVFPGVSGGEIIRFGIKGNFYLLVSQDPKRRSPYDEGWMMTSLPLTYGYLNKFRDILLSRGSRVVREFAEKTEFYAMYGIGEYSFAAYRVVWKRMASRLAATVLSSVKTPFGRKKVICTDTTSFFAVDNRLEAHYLCGIVNSSHVEDYIWSFSSAGRGFGAPSVMNTLRIPCFDPENPLHVLVSDLSQKAHQRVARGSDIQEIQEEIDSAVKQLWNITS